MLGVRPGATKKEITKAYRTLARKNHPDRGGDADAFIRISTAYEVLTGATPPPTSGESLAKPEQIQVVRELKTHRDICCARPSLPFSLRVLGR